MINSETQKIISGILVAVLLASQVFFISSVLLIPKPAKAFLGFGDFNVIVGDIYDHLKQVFLAAAKRIAMGYISKFLNQFINKVQDKYKIRNFLYYDQVLSNYYLSNLIRDKVKDPDLQRIYSLMEANYITGQSSGYGGQTDPNRVLIPQLKKAIYDYYIDEGGVPVDQVYQPRVNDRNYWYQAQSYAMYRPGFVESNLRSEFNTFQSAATTAAQLEIAVGNGMKAGRIIGGTCKLNIPTLPKAPTSLNNFESLINKLGLVQLTYAQELPATPIPGGSTTPREIPSTPLPGGLTPGFDYNSSPSSCRSAGGTWQASLQDQARQFIDNPASYLDKHVEKALEKIFDVKFDANDIWSAVGSLVGDFIFNQLNLATSKAGTLNEYPLDANNADIYGSAETEIDVDGDGIPEGYDKNNDGKLDICHHGGVAPNCKNFADVVDTTPYFIPLCRTLNSAISEVTRFDDFLTRNESILRDPKQLKINNQPFARRGSLAGNTVDELINSLENYRLKQFEGPVFVLNRYSKSTAKYTESLSKDGDLDLSNNPFSKGGGSADNLINNTRNILAYMKEIRNQIKSCQNPDADAVARLPLPNIDVEDDFTPPEGGGCYEGVDGDRAKYASQVSNALISALNTFPDIADHKTNPALNPNSAEENTTMINHIVEHLRSSIGRAGRVIKCSGLPSDDKIMVGRMSDQYGEMYDIWTAFDGNLTFRQGANTQDVGLTEWRACECNRDF